MTILNVQEQIQAGIKELENPSVQSVDIELPSGKKMVMSRPRLMKPVEHEDLVETMTALHASSSGVEDFTPGHNSWLD